MKALDTDGLLGPGTVIEDTLVERDILVACMDILREFAPVNHQLVTSAISDDYGITYEELVDMEDANFFDLGWLVWELVFGLMEGLAPEGYYFGAHIGNGTDFGFWEVHGE